MIVDVSMTFGIHGLPISTYASALRWLSVRAYTCVLVVIRNPNAFVCVQPWCICSGEAGHT